MCVLDNNRKERDNPKNGASAYCHQIHDTLKVFHGAVLIDPKQGHTFLEMLEQQISGLRTALERDIRMKR